MSVKPSKVSRYPTPALEKGLDILELFASEPAGLTKSEVARRLDRTVSEIFRMLVCLEERGYISQAPEGERYHLTLHLFRLVQEHPPIKRMITEALPIMQQVAHDLNQSCHLGVLCKHNKATAPRDLASHLAAIKLRGYEEKESYQVEGVINVSCPILDEYGYAVAALTVPYIRRIGDNTTPTTVRQSLKQASFQLSQAIGGISQRRTKLAT